MQPQQEASSQNQMLGIALSWCNSKECLQFLHKIVNSSMLLNTLLK